MSVQLSYVVVQALVAHLQPLLQGARWQNAFTQQAGELVVAFRQANGRPLFLRMGCSGNLTYLVPTDSFRRARTNSLNIFPQLNDQPLQGLYLVPGERLVVLQLPHHQVVLKLHGRHSNVLVLNNQGLVEDHFVRGLATDAHFRLPHPPPLADQVAAALAQVEGLADADALLQLPAVLPWLGRWPLPQLQALMDGGHNLPGALHAWLQAMQQPSLGIARQPQPVLLAWPPALPPPPHVEECANPARALQQWLQLAWSHSRRQQLSRQLEAALARAEQQATYRAHSSRQSLQHVQQQVAQHDPAQWGHLLLAHPHQVQPGQQRVRLPNLFALPGQPNEVELELDPRRSLAQNAERYYALSRSLHQQALHAQRNLDAALDQLAAVRQARQQAAQEARLEPLERLWRRWVGTQAQGRKAPAAVPYRQVEHLGWRIWVGRNARANDALSFGLARAHDHWFHARDAAGAHVVVPCGKQQVVPASVAEFAAALAAGQSRLRTSAWVPVWHTQRKFVRKAKGMGPGQVLVERGEVLLVQPLPFPEPNEDEG